VRDFARYWLPFLLCAACILGTSPDALSAEHTGDWLAEIVRFLLGHPLPPARFELLHEVVRKSAHVAVYALLGALAFRALRGARGGWAWGWAAGAVGMAVAVASLDEWHQSFVPSRTGTPVDVAIDAVGAIVAQASIVLYHRAHDSRVHRRRDRLDREAAGRGDRGRG